MKKVLRTLLCLAMLAAMIVGAEGPESRDGVRLRTLQLVPDDERQRRRAHRGDE